MEVNITFSFLWVGEKLTVLRKKRLIILRRFLKKSLSNVNKQKSYQLLSLLCVLSFIGTLNLNAIAEPPNQEKNEQMSQHYRNRLGKQKSPYLLQHANNPVDWYPWGEEAFEKAKKENKPIFLSIGYSTCHWCHVMEHESFENSEIAELMNKYFIAIKVDREERPDIDGIYMTAVTAMTGQGGWPLNVFLTPDRKPFYGGTYFPPEPRWGAPAFSQVLTSIHEAWENQQEQILKSSQSLTDLLNKTIEPQTGQALGDVKTLKSGFAQFEENFDSQHGGFGSQPKFPSSHNLSFLLRYWKRTLAPKALSMVEKTLQEMAKGGMYDQLGGGFHRYSTDERWHIPHFEKMLYDQAILAKTYLEAYQATGHESYAKVARDIFDYVLRDMKDKDGGFYSAEDADSAAVPAGGSAAVPAGGSAASFDLAQDGPERSRGAVLAGGSFPETQSAEKKEGAFYVWSAQEVEAVLGKQDAEIFNYTFGVEVSGNAQSDPQGEFIGKNILYVAHSAQEAAKRFRRTETEIAQILARLRQKLLTARDQRPRPSLDDKILTDWNGLMISSLAFGSRVLEEPRYKDAAVAAAEFILERLTTQDGRLLHRWRDGEAAIPGTLADYAFFVHGLLDLYEATFQVRYLKSADRFAREMIRLFSDESSGGFFVTSSDAEELIVRQKEIYDGAVPSGNSLACLDLLRLASITLNEEWHKEAQKFFKAFAGEISRRPAAYTQTLMALDYFLGPSQEIVLSTDGPAKEIDEMLRALYRRFLPNKIVILRDSADKNLQDLLALASFLKEQPVLKGRPTAYVCQNHVCQLPVSDLKKFEALLDQEKKQSPSLDLK